ncbi:MAG TPA: selenocysteine-specific translation elongation factor [Gemmatimonadaceae bacterium]
MILGTAGHIDHGKTTLVRALTGVDTDRLPEEKRRGITIDLGFAPLELEGVGTLGVVDVPGHEAFVRTMVAGATGIHLAMLVVAADEGVMPQTREHLAVLSLLAVRGGVVALTKCDLVDDDWLALVEEDVRAALAGSALDGVPILRVSATTGDGLPALRRALADEALRLPPVHERDLFRLPIDRAFTVRGTGSVVTGTVWSGAVARDATLRLLPADRVVRVRGLQAHGHAVDRMNEGERAAIAVHGADVTELARGAVLVEGDAWHPSRVMRADVTLLPDAPTPITSRRWVRLHLGTAEVGARLVGPEGNVLPEATTSVRLVLDHPLVARAGDRFVLRDASPARTIGGGVIIDPAAPMRARPWPLEPRTPSHLLRHLLDEAGSHGVPTHELPVRLGISPSRAQEVVARHDAWPVGSRLVGATARAELEHAVVRAVREHHAASPLEPGPQLQWLRSRLKAPEEVATAAIDALQARGVVLVEQGMVRLPDFAPRLSPEEAAIGTRLLAALDAGGHEPPSLDELGTALDVPVGSLTAVARHLAREGTLVAVEPSRYYRAGTVERLVTRLRAGMSGDVGYGPAELRELLGFSRKFLIPFLEYCDRAGITRRDLEGKRRLVDGARTIS